MHIALALGLTQQMKLLPFSRHPEHELGRTYIKCKKGIEWRIIIYLAKSAA